MHIVLTAAAALLVVGITLSMVGCTSNLPIRTNLDPTGGDPHQAVIVSGDAYKMGFVEFDDQGWFWNREQKRAVEKMIRQEAGIDTAGATAQGIILVAFVHGWMDNAKYDNNGVIAFGNILGQLNSAEQAQKDHPPRKLVGVYLAWRGLSVEVPGLDLLTFWGRKDTAHKVGGYGAMAEMLADLEDIQEESLDKLPKDAPRTELIIIGHSFGGAAVFTAVSNIISERFVATIEKGKRLRPMGDQIILLNPAFEAMRYEDLYQLAKGIAHFPRDQRPVLTIFQSRGDLATRIAFPAGRFFSTLLDSNRDSDQRKAGLETVGWFKRFLNHDLEYNKDVSIPTTRTSTLNPASSKHEFHDPETMRLSVENIKAQRGKWHPNGAKAQTYYFDDSILKPIDDYRPGDPFFVVSVDTHIMKDHTDITNTKLINFIREYIQFCEIEPSDHNK